MDLGKSLHWYGPEHAILMGCQAGFEKEVFSEFSQKEHPRCGPEVGFTKFKENQGYVVWQGHQFPSKDKALDLYSPHALTWVPGFARWVLKAPFRVVDLDQKDRLTQLWERVECLLKELRQGENPLSDQSYFSLLSQRFLVLHADTNEGRTIAPVARTLERLMNGRVEMLKKDLKPEFILPSPWTVGVFLDSFHTAYVGLLVASRSEPWMGGIPKLKTPPGAPSRSSLKLEEALCRLAYHRTGEPKMAKVVARGETAVDLGASPGGWTFQLVRHGVYVTAIDNGPMDPQLLESGLVRHLREDAFKYMAPQPVDWLVCDVVEQPHRIVERVNQWVESEKCRACVVNFKLPMKKKWEAVQSVLERLQRPHWPSRPGSALRPFHIFWKHLYFDRDEITVILW